MLSGRREDFQGPRFTAGVTEHLFPLQRGEVLYHRAACPVKKLRELANRWRVPVDVGEIADCDHNIGLLECQVLAWHGGG